MHRKTHCTAANKFPGWRLYHFRQPYYRGRRATLTKLYHMTIFVRTIA